MNLPVKHEEGAEHWLGASSLELVRARLKCAIFANPHLTSKDRKRVLKEVDAMIEYEREQRVRTGIYRREREYLEHRIEQVQRAAEVVRDVRLMKARLEDELARYARDKAGYRIDIAERILQLRAKYKPAESPNAHLKELLLMKQRQQIAEAKEREMLDSITRRAKHRAAFIEAVNEKFPDLADELTDYYDQQVFRHTARRQQ